MNFVYIFLLFFVLLFLIMGIYFKIAAKFNIIDKPNERSSHTLLTIRGGGIIFPIAVIFYVLLFKFEYPWFLAGLVLISVISFIDDVKTLNGKVRMVFQFLAIGLLFVDVGIIKFPVYFLIPLLIAGVATINAWNFMDGINGITGGYSLLVIISLLYVDDSVLNFGSKPLMIAVALALLVFLFYNFRTQARCFAGDVGSVSIAFIIVFLIAELLVASGNINYLSFILLYGLDSTTTVFLRVLRKENILEPHRSHLYQYLANERGLPHNTVSLIYIFVQLAINIVVLYFDFTSLSTFLIMVFTGAVTFLVLRIKLEGKERLLGIIKTN